MNALFKRVFYLSILLVLLFNCKDKSNNESESFILIPKNSYSTSSYNGIQIFKLTEDKKTMNGYYVIGDKFTKWEEFNVKEGILNGDYIVFHQNGEKFSHSQYSNGKLHGSDSLYYLSGKPKTVKSYSNGVLYGETFEYFESGQLKSVSKIENEKPIESTSYNIIGEIESQMFIKEGKRINQKIINGKLLSEQISSTYDNFEAMKFYNEDGSLGVYLRMLSEGDKHYLIELDENNNEIKRIDVKANPEAVMKYQEYLKNI